MVDLGTTKVLVADDEPSTRAMVARHLRSTGYKVIEAVDGDEAFAAALEHLPDIVVLDVMMPGMSGWEVCRHIRETVSLAHTGVIILSGIGESLNEMTSPLYGADAHLDKPFDFAVLNATIAETLEKRRDRVGRLDEADVEIVQTMSDPEEDLEAAPVARRAAGENSKGRRKRAKKLQPLRDLDASEPKYADFGALTQDDAGAVERKVTKPVRAKPLKAKQAAADSSSDPAPAPKKISRKSKSTAATRESGASDSAPENSASTESKKEKKQSKAPKTEPTKAKATKPPKTAKVAAKPKQVAKAAGAKSPAKVGKVAPEKKVAAKGAKASKAKAKATAPKKATGKKVAVTAKKAPSKRGAAKPATAKKPAPKKAAANNAVSKRLPAKKATGKKATAKKATAKKATGKKATGKKVIFKATIGVGGKSAKKAAKKAAKKK